MKMVNQEDSWIVDAIAGGDFDYCLDFLITSLEGRKLAIGEPLKNPMNPQNFIEPPKMHVQSYPVGSVVRFKAGISPKYLVGLTAQVTKNNRATVTVKIPDSPEYRRFQGKINVRCPLSVVEAA